MGRIARHEVFEEKPSEPVEFLRKNAFRHGDVVSFDDYRDSDSYIVTEKDGGLGWIKNVDDLDSDFLTIPASITRFEKDAVYLYSKICAKRHVTLHLSAEDNFVIKNLGKVPKNWDFTLYYEDGKLQQAHVWTPEKQWNDLGDPTKLSPESVAKFIA
eukprot:Polyplicarium_translucidae@DN3187_c0_g1_i1.p1